MLRTRPFARVVTAATLFLVPLSVGACYRVRSQLIATAVPAEDVFRCVQLELGRSGYAIVGADRASGWIHAQKRIERFFDVDRAEIYATVIPPNSNGSSHLQLTDNTYAKEDADRLRANCAPSSDS